jgi:hypothetical protein
MNQRPILIYGRVEGGVSLAPAKRRRTLQACFFSPLVTHHCLRGGEEKSNRNNPTFKNRRNPMKIKNKPFSNRNKNSTSGLPHFRPPQTSTRPPLPDLLGAVQGRAGADVLTAPQMSPSSWKRTGCPRVLLTFAFDSPTFWHAGEDKHWCGRSQAQEIAELTSRRGNRWR